MAEVVQRHLEEMLPEFEQAKKLGLFSEKEIKKIVRIRRRHEYRIIRRTKEKECYLDYIKYESQLLKLVQLRREKMKLSKGLKKYEIDLSIKRRIERLFRSVCHRFKKDVQLWLTFIEFLKKQRDFSTASSTFTSALQTHGNKYWLWIMAAKFEFELMVSPSSARTLFQRALRLMPQEKKLWLEYFKFELLYVEMVQKRQAILDRKRVDDEDAVLHGKIVEIVFRNAQTAIESHDPEFLCSFVEILNEFSQISFSQSLTEEIYRTLDEKYSNNCLAKSLIARRPLIGERKMLDDAAKKDQDVSFLIAVLEEQVRQNYQNFLENSSLDQSAIRNFYLDFCLERLEKSSEINKNQHLSICDQVFTEANDRIPLSVDRFLQWISLVEQERSEIVIHKAIETHPDEPKLWEKYLTLFIEQKRPTEKIKEIFSQIYRRTKVKNSPAIWATLVQYAEANDPEWLEELFEQSQSEKVDLTVALELKSKFLRWSQKTKSISEVRKLFDRLSKRIPASVEFYIDYIKIELQVRPIEHNRIKNAFEQSLIYFGRTSADLWLFYLDYLRENQSTDFVAASRVHGRAVHALESDELKRFNEECAMKNLV